MASEINWERVAEYLIAEAKEQQQRAGSWQSADFLPNDAKVYQDKVYQDTCTLASIAAMLAGAIRFGLMKKD